MNALELQNVTFAYSRQLIIEKATVSIAPFQLIGLVGPNGGGKTTLLQLIMGFLKPDSGTLTLFGKNPTEFQSKIGYVPQVQSFDPLFPITVLEVVLLGALSHKKFLRPFDPQWKKRAYDLLDRLGLGCKIDENFFNLSGGQAQRVLIARALINSPKILILDEPTSNIDRENEKILYEILRSLKKEMTIFMVSHNLSMLASEIDEALLVNRTVCPLKPQELCKHYSLGLFHPPIQLKRS